VAGLENAIQLFKANKLRSCEKVCRRLLKKEPASVDALRLLHEIYNQRGDFDHLADVYDSLVRHGKQHAEYLDWCSSAAQLGLRLNRPASVRRALRPILASNPADSHAQHLLAQQEYLSGKFSVALEISESALELLLAKPGQIAGAQVEDVGRLAYLVSQLVNDSGA
jgi:predicted Zn-dependent protease